MHLTRNINSRRAGVMAFIAMASCGRNPASDTSPAALARRGATLRTDQVWLLGLAGTSPTDTVVAFNSAIARTVVMRHGPPDNAIFAILVLPAGSITPAGGDSARIALRVTPGRFGVTIDTRDRIGDSVTLTFSYAMHFAAPEGIAPRYPTPGVFEQSLAAFRISDSTHVTFVPSERPATDMIRLAVRQAGTYGLGAVR